MIIGDGVTALRACVTNKTQTEDVDVLVEALESARDKRAIFAGCSNTGVSS